MAASVLFLSAACGSLTNDRRAAWRDDVEQACISSGAVKTSAKIVEIAPIEGQGACGMNHPFKVSALPGSGVAFSRPVAMACPMIPALDTWVEHVVQPAAERHFGVRVAQVDTVGAYSCRRIARSSRISEHAFGNAFDISGFKLADGRRIRVGKPMTSMPTFQLSAEAVEKSKAATEMEEGDWNYDLDATGQGPAAETYGMPIEEALAEPFIDEVRAGACNGFSTVLGPGQADHEDHLHLDLARYARSGKRVCK